MSELGLSELGLEMTDKGRKQNGVTRQVSGLNPLTVQSCPAARRGFKCIGRRRDMALVKVSQKEDKSSEGEKSNNSRLK